MLRPQPGPQVTTFHYGDGVTASYAEVTASNNRVRYQQGKTESAYPGNLW